ncbi:BTB/POZ domain-containing protein [Hirschfeldia incana]|nr:BTB/POZ domain-containing protein [Hirschfeldia incana]
MAEGRKRKFERVDFLSDHVMALKEAIHADFILKPGDNGPGIPTHKAVLAVKSKVFRSMLETDECKVSPEKSITIHDLSYGELESLLEFFYSGTLSPDSKHVRALYLAADKYDIQYLQDICREILISSLRSENVLDIIQLSIIPSDATLKEAAIDFFIRKNLGMVFHESFETFALEDPSTTLEIFQACIRFLRTFCQKPTQPQ